MTTIHGMKSENKRPMRKAVKRRLKSSLNGQRDSSSPPRKAQSKSNSLSHKSEVKPNKLGAKYTPDPDEMTDEERQLAEAQAIEFPGGVETLLPVPSRKPLPEIPKRPGRKLWLVEIIQHAPHIYQKLIGQIRSGVSFNVAAECAGINESTFYDWGWKGSNDLESDTDTYYSRFYRDVRRAVANITAEKERLIAEVSPSKWLSQGAARIFGNPWGQKNPNKRIPPTGNKNLMLGHTHDDKQPNLPPDEAIDAAFTIVHNPPDDEEEDDSEQAQQETSTGIEVTQDTAKAIQASPRSKRERRGATTVLQLSPEQEFQALNILESIQQITLSPALREAYEQQISSPSQE